MPAPLSNTRIASVHAVRAGATVGRILRRVRIRSVINPIARGKPLLLLPDACLVRWRADEPVPEVGALYPSDAERLMVTSAQADAVRRVLLSADPLERCDAAKALPIRLLRRIYSYQQANHLLHVAEHLCAEIRQHVRALAELKQHTSLHHLITVSYGTTVEEQLRRWNAPLEASDRRDDARRTSRAARQSRSTRTQQDGNAEPPSSRADVRFR